MLLNEFPVVHQDVFKAPGSVRTELQEEMVSSNCTSARVEAGKVESDIDSYQFEH